MAWMKINIFWATLAKELIHLGQKRQSAAISKYWKSTKFRLSPRLYKVNVSHHSLPTPIYRGMLVKHESFYI